MKLIELASKTVTSIALTVCLTPPINASVSVAAAGDDASAAAATLSASTRSLVFKDEAMGPDQIDFLRTKFPTLEEVSRAFTEDPRDRFREDLDGRMVTIPKAEQKAMLLKTVKANFTYYVHKGAAVEIYIPDERVRRDEIVLGKKLLGNRFNSNATVFEDLIRGAQGIYQAVQDHGHGSVLFLGRSPCWMQRVFESLPGVTAQSVHVSYSGNADAMSLRSDPFFRDQHINTARNMVTADRLEFFEDYLTRQGLDKIEDKIYLVDTLTTGVSLNSFLRILRHYYTVNLGREEMPDVHFIGQGLPFQNFFHPVGRNLVWLYQHSKGELIFTDKFKDYGVRPLTIKATPLQLASLTILILDEDWIQYDYMHGYYFPAWRWNKEHTDALTKGGEYHEFISDFIMRGLSVLFRRPDKPLVLDSHSV